MFNIITLISKENNIYSNRSIRTSVNGLQNRISMTKGPIDEFFYDIYSYNSCEYLVKCEFTTKNSYNVYTKYFIYNSKTNKVYMKQSKDFSNDIEHQVLSIINQLSRDNAVLLTDKRFIDTKNFQDRMYNLYITENEYCGNKRTEKYYVKCIPLQLPQRLKECNKSLNCKLITWSDRDLIEALCNVYLYNNKDEYSYKIIS